MKLTKQQKILLAKHGTVRPANFVASLLAEKRLRDKMQQKAWKQTRVWKRRWLENEGELVEGNKYYRYEDLPVYAQGEADRRHNA